MRNFRNWERGNSLKGKGIHYYGILPTAILLALAVFFVVGCTKDGSDEVDPSDKTAPEISSVTPENNAGSVSKTVIITVIFNENMDPSTFSASTFTLKQGTTIIPGTVICSANVATFTPASVLVTGTTYTATIIAGVKDATGNTLATSYSWSFSTASVSTGLSFANDVVPVLTLCNACHTHKWTTSSNVTTFYNNLVSGAYINAAAPTSSKFYTRINNGHTSPTISAENANKILTWMNEGSKNN
jgi:hypothetical protein